MRPHYVYIWTAVRTLPNGDLKQITRYSADKDKAIRAANKLGQPVERVRAVKSGVAVVVWP